MIIWISNTPPVVSCSLLLDDDGTVASAFGADHLIMESPGYQTFDYEQTATAATLLGISADPITNSFPLPTAPMQVQYTCTARTAPTVGRTGGGGLLIAVISSGGAPVGNVVIGIYEDYDAGGNNAEWAVSVNGSAPPGMGGTYFGSSILNASVSLYVMPDGTIGGTANGADIGIIPGITVGETDTFTVGIVVNDDAVYTAGNTLSGSLITAADQITEPSLTGATDICGNPIPQVI